MRIEAKLPVPNELQCGILERRKRKLVVSLLLEFRLGASLEFRGITTYVIGSGCMEDRAVPRNSIYSIRSRLYIVSIIGLPNQHNSNETLRIESFTVDQVRIKL